MNMDIGHPPQSGSDALYFLLQFADGIHFHPLKGGKGLGDKTTHAQPYLADIQ